MIRGDGGYIDNVEIDTAYHMGNFPVVSPEVTFLKYVLEVDTFFLLISLPSFTPSAALR